MITALEISTRALGNSLFSYATLFGVGKKLNLDIRMPTGQNHTHEPTGQKIWQLKEIFDINTPYITQAEIDSIQHTYTEKRKEFNPEIFEETKDNTNLIGFFQHEDYFSFCSTELKEQLKFKEKWNVCASENWKNLGIGTNPKNCIAMHIRRGDYTKEHLQNFHPLLPLGYYKQALEEIAKFFIDNSINIKDGPEKILIFTDDKEYCKKIFTGESIIIVDNPGEHGNILDLLMMSRCGYHILANSSFSWWGAWLADSKCVVYPHVWFGPGYGNYNIVSNPKWIKI